MKKFILFNLLVLSFFSDVVHAQTTPLHPPPVPNFYITGLCFGDTTRFINKTEFALISWAVMNDKGDTIYKAKGEQAAYYFKKRGLYDVCLIADNGHIATKVRTVSVDTVTRANFIYRSCYNEFNNLSTCSDHFIWMLPDNVTATDTFPNYQFKHAGTHLVKLIAKKGNKADTIVKMITVTADSLGIPDGLFTFRKTGASPSTFEFKAADSLASQYSWFFGDRQFDDTSGYKVIHEIILSKYEPPVELRIANGCGYTFYKVDPFENTGIAKQQHTDLSILVYPNPARDMFMLSIKNNAVNTSMLVRLVNANGAIVQENTIAITSHNYTLNYETSKLAKGLYLLQLIAGGELVSKRVLVQ